MSKRVSSVQSAIRLAVCAGAFATVGLSDVRAQNTSVSPDAKADSKASAAQPTASSGESVVLTPKYEVGKTMQFEQRTKRADFTQITGMATQHVDMDQTATWAVKVISADAEKTVLEFKLEAIKAELSQATKQANPGAEGDAPAAKLSWDSAAPEANKDENNPLLQGFKPIIGAVLSVSLGADGNITTVTGNEQLGGARSAVGPYVQQLVGTEAFKLRWSGPLWIKDGKAAAKVGESWTNTDEVATPPIGRTRVSTKNTLQSTKDGMATIEISGTTEVLPLKEGETAAGKVTASSIAGTAMWDTKAGFVRSVNLVQKTSMDVNAAGIAMKRDSDATITITRK